MRNKTSIILLWLSAAVALSAQGLATSPSPPPSGIAEDLESPAAQINKGLPSWLIFGGDYRSRFEGYSGGSYKPNTTDAYLLSRLKLDLTIRPAAWMKFFIEGMDARALEKTPAVPTYQK